MRTTFLEIGAHVVWPGALAARVSIGHLATVAAVPLLVEQWRDSEGRSPLSLLSGELLRVVTTDGKLVVLATEMHTYRA